jgi:hypothetical protein
MTGPRPGPTREAGPWRRVVAAVLALGLLNALLSMNNLWPTPLVVPDHRISPELVVLWCGLLAYGRWVGVPGPRLLALLGLTLTALVLGRYADITVPALFGRPINLYWDGAQIPRFLAVSAQDLPGPRLVGLLTVAVGVAGLLWALYRGLRGLVAVVVRDAVPLALGSRGCLLASGVAAVVVAGNYAGVRATWPVVSRPVLPTYVRQAELLATAFLPGRLATVLPPSPSFDTGVSVLAGADVTLIFLESYGAVAFDDARMHAQLAPQRERLARGIAASGRRVMSAFVTSPTFGGASELAHLGLLSGLDLTDPLRHDLLLTSDRPTLVSFLRGHGYRTYGLYPALSWDWPEKSFYGFDVFLDGRDLDWRGPKLGLWWIPDQYTIARFHELHGAGDGPPRLLFFPTITSHAPFVPVPPYQPDWARMLSAEPYDAPDVARSMAQRTDWLDLYPGYTGMIGYTYDWLGGWLARPRARRELVLILGDHQPTAGVTGPGARWDVPVHVVSDDPHVLERLRAAGFVEGLEPASRPIGPLHGLTGLLLEAFDGSVPAAAKGSNGGRG